MAAYGEYLLAADRQFRYGDASHRQDPEVSDDDEFRARAMAIRLLMWSGAVTAAGVALMWPAIHLPRLVAVVAFVFLGVAALLALARWVPDARDGQSTILPRTWRKDTQSVGEDDRCH